MAASKQTNNEILTQLQIDMATTQRDVKNLDGKVDGIDKKLETGFENLKGYVPANIYALHMEAQKIINENHDSRIKVLEGFIENNKPGIGFSNDIVKNILKTIGAVAAAALVIGAAFILLKNGGGI